METGCPAKCGKFAIQRPLSAREFCQLRNSIRAQIVLLAQTAWLCESCGSVYVTSESKPVLLERLPVVKP